jgi:hypothetical protein
MTPLPTVRAAILAEPEKAVQLWLIEGLWMRQASASSAASPNAAHRLFF